MMNELWLIGAMANYHISIERQKKIDGGLMRKLRVTDEF